MNLADEKWLYYVDDTVVKSMLQAEPELREMVPGMKERAVSSPAVVQAVSLYLEGKKEEAIRRLEKAAQLPDAASDVFSFLANFEIERQRVPEAAAYFEKAVKLNPGSKTDLYNLGVCRYREGNWAVAADLFRRAAEVDLDSGRAECLLARAICHLHLSEPPAALDLFEQVLRQESDSRTAWFGKAVALHLMRKRDDAEQIYRRLQQEDAQAGRPENPELLLNRLSIALFVRDEALIRELADKLLALGEPLYLMAAQEALATVAFHRERFTDAAKHLEKLTELMPGVAEAWFNLGVARQQLGQVRPAIEAYLTAVEIEPSLKQAHANLGYLHHQRGDGEAARQAYVEALNLDPQMAETMWNLAVLLDQQGHESEAAVCFEQLTRLAPDWEEPWFRLALNHLAAERWDQAVKPLENCLQLRADWSEAALGLAVARARLGDADAARSILENVRTIDPKPGILFNLGVLHQQANRHLEAAQCYRQAIEAKPDFAEAFLNLGHALDASGKGDDARESWRKAVKLNPSFAAGFYA